MSEPSEGAVIRLMLAYLCVSKEAEASLERKVQILDRFELADGEIAQVCDVALQSVRNARANVKRSSGGKKKA